MEKGMAGGCGVCGGVTFCAVNFKKSSDSTFYTKKGKDFEWDTCEITELKQPHVM